MDTFFLISSMRGLWLLMFCRESIVILLSVKMAAVRGPFPVTFNVYIAFSALSMTSCSAWLLEHLLSSLNFFVRRLHFQQRLPHRIQLRAHSCCCLCITGLCVPCFLSFNNFNRICRVRPIFKFHFSVNEMFLASSPPF